ncbi:43198_t:CDS:2 [Gigaspora margarita]|uniref:Chitin synthase n=1 Tax=Gigaspora margarita TaxID=4874 RepID=A0ABN7VEP7_GIGMA|nr:43198_t:CDS:2 [Gigaspora margarita]
MSSVINNVAYFCSKKESKSWENEDILSIMGCYHDGIVQTSKKVKAHLFEYTTQLMVDNNFNVQGKDNNIPPVQVMFCLKEKNAKKLNFHRWSFKAFAALLEPKICILLDVGTRPSQTSVYRLWKAFDRDHDVGGACGKIKVDLGHKCRNLLNPLIASQNFEYKISNILDKLSESVFGETTNNSGATKTGIFEANMYLAEDRILSFELSAKAETDIPDNVPEFISQRRRWLNRFFFTTFYSIAKFTHSTTSNPTTDPFNGHGDNLF